MPSAAMAQATTIAARQLQLLATTPVSRPPVTPGA
jgi:hypothetical protein